MRSTRRWPLLVAFLAASGCTADETSAPPPDDAALKLSVVGNPRYLTGKVTVLLEAPQGAVSHVELDLRGQKVATDEDEPFSFELDSTAFEDGAAELTAKATLAGSGKS